MPALDLANSPRLQSLIRDGKLYISLHDAIAVAIENNLDLASFRYNLPTALTDLARTKAGYSALGVNTSISSPAGASSGSGLAGGGGVPPPEPVQPAPAAWCTPPSVRAHL